MTTIKVFFVAIFFIFSSSYVIAETVPDPNSGNIIEQLQLTRKQVKRIRQQRKQFQKTVGMLQKKLTHAIAKFEEEIAKETPNENKIEGLTGQIKHLKGKLFEANMEGFLDLNQVLSPDQRKKMMSLKKKSGKKRFESKRRNVAKNKGKAKGKQNK